MKRPIRWLCLEADLLRMTKYDEIDVPYLHMSEFVRSALAFVMHYDDETRPYLLVSEVKEVASAYNMDDCEVESFLEFNHTLGDFLCCSLSNGDRCIITNPQWLMNRFKELVSALLLDLNWYNLGISQRNKTIVSIEDLEDIWESYDAEFLIDLMISFDFILPIGNEKHTYLVPSMLPPEDNFLLETEQTYRAVYNPNIGYILSSGTFRRLLSSCAKQSNWKLNIGGHLRSNNASFEITKGTQLVITQKKDTIRVSTWTSKQELDKGQVSNDEIRGILFDIHKDIARKMEVLGVERSKKFWILCPYWRSVDKYVCLVEVKEQMEIVPDNLLFYPRSKRCAIHGKALEPRLFLMTEVYQKGMYSY